MHKITIDGLDWTSKEEIEINGIRYVKKAKRSPTEVCKAKIVGIQPSYGTNGNEMLKIILEHNTHSLKLPGNSRMMRPGDLITIFKGDVE